MALQRLWTVVWQDVGGLFSAVALAAAPFTMTRSLSLFAPSEEVVGVGATAALALEQLRSYLEWFFRHHPYFENPILETPHLLTIRVDLRPEYQNVDGQIFLCRDTVPLRLPCLWVPQDQGNNLCLLPTLGLRFTYHAEDPLKEIVVRYVQQQLRGLTPRQISRLLPPKPLQLQVLSVSYKPKFAVLEEGLRAFPTLQSVAQPAGDRRFRQRFSRPWLRDAEVQDLIQRLTKDQANVILVGETGSGKTSVLLEVVRMLELPPERQANLPLRVFAEATPKKNPKRQKPKPGREPRSQERQPERPTFQHDTKGPRFWITSGPRLLAGTPFLGQWQERCEELIAELAQVQGVLCIENLLDLFRAGGRDPADSPASFFLPYMLRRELQIIAEATSEELTACRRLMPAFVDSCQLLPLEPFTTRQAQLVLSNVTDTLASQQKIPATPAVPAQVYRLFERFVPYQAFPGKGVTFLYDLFERARRQKKTEISDMDVLELFTQRTGLPDWLLREEVLLEFDTVVETLRARVMGQEEACHEVAHVVTTFKAGLNDAARPLSVLLFCGPTGVGKTELAKALAQYLFGHGEHQDRLVRLDMSEFASYDAADRLLGAVSGQPSPLIQKLRTQPFRVVLFDEIEKAAPEVFDLLLNVFDEGRLTDPFGRLTNFRSSILILTSNLGASSTTSLGFAESAGADYENAARKFFRPEFFNRLDAVVSFLPLKPHTIHNITEKELRELNQREGLRARQLQLVWTPTAVQCLAKLGFHADYGARPLQRVIEQQVAIPLARLLVERPHLTAATIQLDSPSSGQLRLEIQKT